jgi:release factor glutamine methyltransferase
MSATSGTQTTVSASVAALKLSTPSLGAWERADGARCVYEPAQDTFLLLDSLQRDADRFLAQPPALCLEVG